MTIESIRQTSAERLEVCFENGEKLVSTLGVLTEYRLFAGKSLTEEERAELECASRRAIWRDRAIELVSRRRMSEKELHNKLVQKGAEESDAEYCVAWLTEHGMLDDAAYAGAVVRHYSGKGFGEGRIRAELSRRGVPRELWDDALTERGESDDKLRRYIETHLKDPTDRDAVRKLANTLYRRGFSWEEIRSAMREYEERVERQ